MTYTVHARHWERGWELHVDGIGVTQSRTLAGAEAMIRDYLRLDGHADWKDASLAILPDLDGLEARVARARELTRSAERAQLDAAHEARAVARALRAEGLSVSDTATVLGVSRGRVSQLVS
jgi:DNA-directed RNA polymerase specialized sigma24 family protein